MKDMVGDLKSLLAIVAQGRSLSESEAEAAFDIIMSGDATPSQMGAFLMALRVRGETVDEIAGAARTMRAKALAIEAPPGTIDTCGTGGDASGSFNISTASALVAAGCGVPVAKHGNRALSSKSGSADVLTALGVNIDADLSIVRACLWEIGIGFLMAPRHHSATRHVAPTRVELGTRTIFNLLGPLSSPAAARRQLVGVFAREWARPMAEVLGRLGGERAWVVHGDGLDELTTAGPTTVAALDDGKVEMFEITAADVGLPTARLADLRGGEPAHNARLMRDLLAGVGGPLRDVVLLNSGAALLVAGQAADLADGVERAARSIDSGAARRVLEDLVARTNAPADTAEALG
jgi:anthranilate phosphoribosyltransferase